MFERIDIWENAPDCVWVYIVFRDLDTGLFHVQQAIAHYPTDPLPVGRSLAAMGLSETDLFRERSPSKRCAGFATAAEAVTHHKVAFAEMTATFQ